MAKEIKKLRLVSNNVCYGPVPEFDEEIEQRLTLTRDGRVFISFYTYLGILSRICRMKIPAEKASHILTAIAEYFNSEPEIEFWTDIGDWQLVLTDMEGELTEVSSSLSYGHNADLDRLSELIREELSMNSLYVFSGETYTDEDLIS